VGFGLEIPAYTEGIEKYVSGFVRTAKAIREAYPGREVLFEAMSEPWGNTTPEYDAAQYASVIAALLPAVKEAGIPVEDVLVDGSNAEVNGKGEWVEEGWIPGLYEAQPALESEISGWSLQAPGRPKGSEGIDGMVPALRAQMLSGENNILIGVGYCTSDVEAGKDCGSEHASNSTQAAEWLGEALDKALSYREEGWLRALLVYARHEGGFSMQLEDGALTKQGETLIEFADAHTPRLPHDTAAPTIGGTLEDGQTLTASPGTWIGTHPIAYAYQWQSCKNAGGECEDIPGATRQGYTQDSGDVGFSLRVVVTASNSAGSASAVSAATAPVESGAPWELEAPSISGSANAGQVLAAEPGAWGGTGVELSYQWERCNATGEACKAVPGATGSEYAVAEEEEGDTLRVRVGASNEFGSVTALSLATSPIGPAALTLADNVGPSLTGTARSGQTLSVTPGAWTGLAPLTYTYRWERCDPYGLECEERAGLEGASYALGEADAGHTIRVLVSAGDANGSLARTVATAQPVASAGGPLVVEAPSVDGVPVEGKTLYASAGEWSDSGALEYSYQWERCGEDGERCAAIAGATSASYTLAKADLGSALRILVTASDVGGSSLGVSSPTPTIGVSAPLERAAPSISGANEVGEPLSADPGIWSGEGPVSFSYQWQHCNEAGGECANITGATSTTFVPAAGEEHETIRAIVTAVDPHGSSNATSLPSAPVAGIPVAPSDVLAPSVEGSLTAGEVLTATPGVWYGSETISYAYQWQVCDAEGEECTDISGASASTYTLTEGEIGSTIRVIVTASNSAGSESVESARGETVGAAGAPASSGEGPAIRGEGKVGQRLVAENGSWSGSRPLDYVYRWERCNAVGESCAAIEGATTPSYTATSADAEETLRVAVTATNALGRAAALSPTLAVAAAGEASTTSAIELAEGTDPSVLQPSTGATLEEQEVKPTTGDQGEELVAASALTSSSASKETPGEFAVNTSNGELSVSPIDTQPGATKLPTIVNDTAAVYAQTFTATDTIVRPEALGAATLLQLRSSEAPRTFSWEVDLGADQHLESLPNGEVAVVEAAPETYFEEPPGEPFESSAASTEAGEGEGVPGEVAEKELEGSGEEGVLEELPAAPHASTPEVTPRSGELHPQNTAEQYEHGNGAVEYAQTHTEERTLMVFQAPTVIDAAGKAVPASLSSEGETVTLTVSPGEGASYPIAAQTAVTAPTNAASAAKSHTVRHGLSDPKPESFTTTDEEGKSVAGFDTRLKTGTIHVGTARLVLSYNVPPSNKKLREWLKDVGKDNLQPYITLGECEAAEGYPPCPSTKPPTTGMYEKSIKKLISKLDKEDASEGIPRVPIWGAWNEPDNPKFPMSEYPARAANFWQIAQKVAKEIHCNCKIVAGEFLKYDDHTSKSNKYISKYINTIVTDHKYGTGKPHIWGLHDYSDLVQFHETHRNPDAEAFLRLTNRKRLGHPHIWLSELGVELQDNGNWTSLVGHTKWQSEAAEDFLKVGKEHERIEREYYYLYRGPTQAEIEKNSHKHAFDSAFFPGEGVTKEGPGEKYSAEDPRPAYCVLVLGEKGCKPQDKTLGAIGSTISLTSGQVAAVVDPGGSPTTYWIEYGTTTAYGHSTSPAATAGTEGEQSEAVTLPGLELCTTYHYQVAAENEASEGVPSLGGDKAFTTACAATAVSAGWDHACADLKDGRVACWGADEYGDLGDGSFTGPEQCLYFADMCSWAPEPVEGITDAIGVAAGEQQSCALLSGGEVECWGEAAEIENTATPVPIAGVTKATAITVGRDFGCALIAGGSVECWGYNSDGDLGDGGSEWSINDTTGAATSVKVHGITDAIAISAGLYHVCAVLADGNVDCWGSNSDGQLGDGTYTGPEECGDEACSTTPVAVEGITDAITVGVGEHQSCAVLASGEVYCWGENSWGQLGDGTSTGPQECYYARCSMTPVKVENLSGATAVSGGDAHTCATLLIGSVECWGSGGSGQLGAGPSIFNSDTPVPVSGIVDAETISLGSEFSCALLSGGEIDCWGDNLRGELGGHKSEEASYVPLPVEGIG
jgi:alpha-tubulin suppressor-like RCC1 family protein